MKILGIDPGLGRTGWAVITRENSNIEILKFGIIETEKDVKEQLRLSLIKSKIEDVIKEFQPEVLAVEKLFFSKNVRTALSVGQARGVVLLAGAENGLIIEEYTPLQVKLAVTGYGKADKYQIGEMVKNSFGLKSVPKPDDVADALAIALTHAVSYKIRNLA